MEMIDPGNRTILYLLETLKTQIDIQFLKELADI